MININIFRIIQNNTFFTIMKVLLCIGIIISAIGIYSAPLDYLQGIYAKIMFIHVPSAWLSLAIFATIAIFATLFIITKNHTHHLIAAALAPLGLIYTIIALVTGSLWGKPTWGAFWIWDARLTSMLLECFLYIVYLMLNKMPNHPYHRAHICSYFALISALNIPIIKFSVYLWNGLHQKNSIFTLTGPKIDWSMLWVLLCCFITLICLSIVLLTIQLRTISIYKKFNRLHATKII